MSDIQTIRVPVPGFIGPAGPQGPPGPVGPTGPQGPPGGGAEGTTPADGSVTNPKLADVAVTNVKIANDTIEEGKLTPTARSRFLKYESVLTLENLGCKNDGTDQTANFKAAMLTAAGRPVTGEGKTYHLAPVLVELSKTVDHRLRDTKFVLLNPPNNTAWRMLYWAPTDPTRVLHWKNVSYYCGNNPYAGDDGLSPPLGADTAVILITGGRPILEDVEVSGYGRVSAMLLIGCNDPRVIRPHIHDMVYSWEGDAILTEPALGLRIDASSGCAYVEDMQIHRLGSLLHWIAGDTITRGKQRRWYEANAYVADAGPDRTTGFTPPTHTSGTVNYGDGINWTYLGDKSLALRYYNIGGFSATTNEKLYVSGGHITFTGEGTDCNGENLTFSNVIIEDSDGFGFKFAHHVAHLRLYDCVAKRSSIANYTLAGDSTSFDIGVVNCYSENPGVVTGYGEVWPGTHVGFWPGAEARGVWFQGCSAVDNQTPHLMSYGFYSEGLDGFAVIDDHCTSVGHTVADVSTTFRTRGTRARLNLNTVIYVRPDGNDSNTGYQNDATGAFLTIQAAINAATALDFNGKNCSIVIAPGTYTQALNISGHAVGQQGAQNFIIRGSTGVAGDIVIAPAAPNVPITVTGAARVQLTAMTLQGNTGVTLDCYNQAYVEFGNIKFTGGIRHVQCQRGARAVCISNYEIAAGGLNHLFANYGSHIEVVNKTVTITGTPAFSNAFAVVAACAQMRIDGNTFSGSATGQRYIASLNGVIISGGATLPGDVAGTTTTGGQYV